MDTIDGQLEQWIAGIDNEMYDKFKGNAGSTVVGAIVGKDKTIIFNVGDSKAFVYAEGELKEVSTEDNLARRMYEKNNYGMTRDSVRFNRRGNTLTQSIGTGTYGPEVHINTINNKGVLILTTDGVTDCLEEDTIKIMAKETDTSNLAREMVQFSLNFDSQLSQKDRYIAQKNEISEMYYNSIKAGRDNTTAAVTRLDSNER